MAKDKSIPSNIVLAKEKFKYDTIQDMVNDIALKVGMVVDINGYYKPDDGATHKRVIADTDDGSGVQLRNGKWANILENEIYIDITWLGAKRNENINASPITTQAFKKALSYGKNVFIPEGIFYIDEPLFVNVNKQWLRGISSRSSIYISNSFPENECAVNFYSTDLEAFYTRIGRSQKHGNFSIHGLNNNNWKANGIRVGGIAGTDKEGHVECQIFENIMCQFVNKTLCWGSHAYRNTFSHLDSNIANYSIYSDENQIDSGEATVFINCGLWNGSINLRTGCKFVSCTIHFGNEQIVDNKKCSHYFTNGDYEFIGCHFESILRTENEWNKVRENIFYTLNSYVSFNNCNMGIAGEYATIKNAFFLSESTKDNNQGSFINVDGGHYYYLFSRLKGDFVLLKGNGKMQNITQRYVYDGATSPKRYESNESFVISNSFNKDYIYDIGFSDTEITTIKKENLENGDIKFNIKRTISRNAKCGVYNYVNVNGNVNVRFCLEVELRSLKTQVQVQDNGWSLICLDENDNIINMSENNINFEFYSALEAKNIGDTFTFEESFDIPIGTKKILYGVGINSNSLDIEFIVKKCYVELI